MVARSEVERGEVGVLAQQHVDLADVLEPDGPVDVVDQAQAANDVAGGDVAARQGLVFGNDDFFGIRAGFLQLAFQPFQRPARVLRTVAQPVEKLGRKGGVLGMRAVFCEKVLPLPAFGGRQHLVCNVVRDLAHVARPADTHGQPPQVLHKHETQQRRQCP